MDYPAQLSKLIAGPIILEITMTDTAIPFRPDWVSPPGDTIADLMEERGWPQAELAVRLGYTTKHVSQLINGKAAATEDTALRFERVLGAGLPSGLRVRLNSGHNVLAWPLPAVSRNGPTGSTSFP